MKFYSPFILAAIALFTTSCDQEEDLDYPLIQTGEVTDISATGATFHADVIYVGDHPIEEYGFLWSTSEKSLNTRPEKFAFTGEPAPGTISQRIFSNLPADTITVKSFIRSGSYTAYGREVKFVAQGGSGPALLEFYPEKANLNDTIVIVGEQFSHYPEKNQVFFDRFQARLLRSTSDTLIAVVPEALDLETSAIKVRSGGSENTFSSPFSLNTFQLTAFEAKTGTWNDVITLEGTQMNISPETLKVYLNETEVEVLNVSPTQIQVRVPETLNAKEVSITVELNNIKKQFEEVFVLEGPAINDFFPKEIATGETLEITGSNFSPVAENTRVFIGGHEAFVITAEPNRLEVIVPLQSKHFYEDRSVQIEVHSLEEVYTFSSTLTLNDPFWRVTDYPGSLTKGLMHFSYGDQIYMGLNNSGEFWKYDPQSTTWTSLSPFPGQVRRNGTGFLIGQTYYYGTGNTLDPPYSGQELLQDMWAYDIAGDTWERKSDFIFPITRTSGVTARDKGYFVGGMDRVWRAINGTWAYDPQTDSWAPAVSYGDTTGEEAPFYYNGMSISLGAISYYGLPHTEWNSPHAQRFYLFDPEAETPWALMPDFPGNAESFYGPQQGLAIGNQLYVVSNGVDLYHFDTTAQTWSSALPLPLFEPMDSGIAVAVNGKIYLGLGSTDQLWEYTPNP